MPTRRKKGPKPAHRELPAGARVRIQKILADAGLGSRRRCEEWIRAGRVSLNGKTILRLGTQANPASDRIQVDGRPIPRPERKLYFLLNKPRGCVTTLSDPEGRPTVRDLLKGVRERVFPVGRLDVNTEGLLILTNDGEFAQAVAHPSRGCAKRYVAKVRDPLSTSDLRSLRHGIVLDGKRCLPMAVRVLVRTRNPSYEMILHEGRRNQIRRIFLVLGHPVQKLRRVAIGSLRDPQLPRGAFRPLTPRELLRLRRETENEAKGRKQQSTEATRRGG